MPIEFGENVLQNDDFVVETNNSGDLVQEHKQTGARFKFDTSKNAWVPVEGLDLEGADLVGANSIEGSDVSVTSVSSDSAEVSGTTTTGALEAGRSVTATLLDLLEEETYLSFGGATAGEPYTGFAFGSLRTLTSDETKGIADARSSDLSRSRLMDITVFGSNESDFEYHFADKILMHNVGGIDVYTSTERSKAPERSYSEDVERLELGFGTVEDDVDLHCQAFIRYHSVPTEGDL